MSAHRRARRKSTDRNEVEDPKTVETLALTKQISSESNATTNSAGESVLVEIDLTNGRAKEPTNGSEAPISSEKNSEEKKQQKACEGQVGQKRVAETKAENQNEVKTEGRQNEKKKEQDKAEKKEKKKKDPYKVAGLTIAGFVFILIGGELLMVASKHILQITGLSGNTAFC